MSLTTYFASIGYKHTYDMGDRVIGKYKNIPFVGSVGNVAVGHEIWTTDTKPLFVGVVKSIASTTSLTLTGMASEYGAGTAISGSYSGGYVFRNSRSIGSLYAPG
jgi:hypothetical protein